MRVSVRNFVKTLVLFLIGGISYYIIEILWRGYSYHAMIIIGGLCFIEIGKLNEGLDWDMLIWKQAASGVMDVLIIEFISGCILNIALGLGMWDYSNVPFNILGQICLPFAIAWYPLSMIAIFVDDFIRWKLFGEEKPRYRWA